MEFYNSHFARSGRGILSRIRDGVDDGNTRLRLPVAITASSPEQQDGSPPIAASTVSTTTRRSAVHKRARPYVSRGVLWQLTRAVRLVAQLATIAIVIVLLMGVATVWGGSKNPISESVHLAAPPASVSATQQQFGALSWSVIANDMMANLSVFPSPPTVSHLPPPQPTGSFPPSPLSQSSHEPSHPASPSIPPVDCRSTWGGCDHPAAASCLGGGRGVEHWVVYFADLADLERSASGCAWWGESSMPNAETLPITNTTSSIPCIFHYQWHGPQREDSHQFVESWKRCLPSNCKVMFWTDETLLDLVNSTYPQYLDLYVKADLPVYRFDMARYLLLHTYGGIYADNDYECTAPDRGFTLPFNVDGSGRGGLPLHVVESPHKKSEHTQNSLIASVRGHPVWIDLMDDIAHVASMGWCITKDGPHSLLDGVPHVLASTGPKRLDKWVVHPKYAACWNVLPIKAYFQGQSMAKHHNKVGWIHQVAKANPQTCSCTTDACKVSHFLCL